MTPKLPLSGLANGLKTTLKTALKPTHTAEYPDVQPTLPPRTRGVIALTIENCTSCMLCARECPDWCIYIEGHKETIPATTPGGRDRQRNVLDTFAIDFSLCMYCGICVEACPFDALHWSPQFEYAEYDIRDLLHQKERLGQWMATVMPPPALDPRAAEAAEVKAANKPARPAPAAAAAGAGAAGAAGERPARPVRAAGDRPARAAGAAGDRPARAAGAAGERPARVPRTAATEGASDAGGPATPQAPAPADPAGTEPTAELPRPSTEPTISLAKDHDDQGKSQATGGDGA